jgi:hypothetical protein
MASIDFGHLSNPGRSGQAGAAHLVNAYVEKTEDGTGKAQTTVYVAPGLTRWDSGAFTGACRGMLPVTNQGLFAVLGNELVQFTTKDNYTDWGGLPGTDPCILAYNLHSPAQVGIVTGGKYWVADIGTGTLTDWSAPNDGGTTPGIFTDFPAPESICFLDRYLVFGIADGKIFHTALDDATTVSPLAFGYASTRSDGLVRVVAHRGALVQLGRRGLEIWEDVGTAPFAFAPIRASIEIGCCAKMSVAQTSEELLWVDDKRIVRQMQGSQPTRISNHGMERALEMLTPAQAAAINGIVYWFQGHQFYSLTSELWTWEYDLSTQIWHERRSKDTTRWIANAAVQTDSGTIVGNEVDGRLYYIDGTSYIDGDNYFVMSAVGQMVHKFPNRVICDSIEVDCIRGRGTVSGNVHTDDPRMMLDWSDDGGETWQGGRTASMGRVGQNQTWVRFNKLGLIEKSGRLFRFSSSAPVLRGIMGVDAAVRPCR